MLPADELRRGTELCDKGALAHLARYEGRLFCEAKGSDPSPYKVSIELALTLAAMKIRCACWASRGRLICKHAAALLVAWARAPGSFAVSDAPPPGAASAEGKKRAVKKGKTEAKDVMRRGVEQVVTLVRELATSGVASLAADRVEQVRALGASLREHGLRRLSARSLDLTGVLSRAGHTGGIPPSAYVEVVADMLLTARKLEKHLDGEPLPDRHTEELVGKTWRKEDRAAVDGLALLEYAYLSYETSDGFDVNESRFMDLASGAHYAEKQIIPRFLAARTEPKVSHATRVLRGARGGAYPGFAPLRLAIEDTGAHEDLGPRAVEELLSRALPGVAAALEAFQEHRRDIFAPGAFPVALRADAVVFEGARPRLLDAAGDALALPEGSPIGEALEAARLRGVLGDIEVEAAFPTLRPLAVVLEGARGLEVRAVPGRGGRSPEGRLDAEARRLEEGSAWAEAARAAGASEAAVALHEVRNELATLFAAGLAALTARAVEPLCARLGELQLAKPAALLASIPAKPETERVDDAVKVFQVLGVVLVRLAGAARIERAGLVPVPGAPSLLVREPARPLSPPDASAAVARGALHPFEAAVHYARWFAEAPAAVLLASILPAWADGAAAPHVVRTLAGRGAEAVDAAARVLDAPYGRAAWITALRVLEAVASGDARRLLARHARTTGLEEFGVRVRAAEALAALESAGAGPAPDVVRQVRESVAALARRLERGGKSEDRRAAARELLELGIPDVLPPLRRAAREDAAREVREEAVRALGILVDVDSVPWLVTSLAARRERDEPAKLAAQALGAI